MKYSTILLLFIASFVNNATGQKIAAVTPHLNTNPTSLTFSIIMPHSNYTMFSVGCMPPPAIFGAVSCFCNFIECDTPPNPTPTLFEKTVNHTIEGGYTSFVTYLFLRENNSLPNCVFRTTTLVDTAYTLVYSNLSIASQLKLESVPFPNPAMGFFMLPLAALPTVSALLLTNQVGQSVPLPRPSMDGRVALPPQLASGLYFLRIETKDGSAIYHSISIIQ